MIVRLYESEFTRNPTDGFSLVESTQLDSGRIFELQIWYETKNPSRLGRLVGIKTSVNKTHWMPDFNSEIPNHVQRAKKQYGNRLLSYGIADITGDKSNSERDFLVKHGVDEFWAYM